jgi:two-component system, NtrC family, response regulator AtoC
MSNKIIRILVIEDEAFDVTRIKNTLMPFNSRIKIEEVVSSGKAALNWLNDNPNSCDVIIMDYQISGGLFGEKLIREIKKFDYTLQIVLITKMTINQTDPQFANQLLESGASWFGTKYPGDIEKYIYQPTDFILSIQNAYDKKSLQVKHLRSEEKLYRNIQDMMESKPMVGDSVKMTDLKQQIQKFASPNANVLVLGESGTGKELVASYLHYESNRKFENFVTVNCAAIPKDLIESELFGFEKGSFTGANSEKAGLFEQADNGTLFLDEITELPFSVQAKLLRVLQEGEIDKIGRKKKHKVNVRVIAATNRDIEEMLDKKEFREDLYYRLNILQIKVPPLRERENDIRILLDFFIRSYSEEMGIKTPLLSEKALKLIENFSWPGNVRQLKNVTHRMVILSHEKITEEIARESIGVDRRHKRGDFEPGFLHQAEIVPLKDMERKFRKAYVEHVRKSSHSDADAAEKLGVAPSNYHRLCKEVGLK